MNKFTDIRFYFVVICSVPAVFFGGYKSTIFGTIPFRVIDTVYLKILVEPIMYRPYFKRFKRLLPLFTDSYAPPPISLI